MDKLRCVMLDEFSSVNLYIGDLFVGTILTPEHARLIVTAVNHHEALVEVLNGLIVEFALCNGTTACKQRAYIDARAILDTIKKESAVK